ncbi:MAG: hypothetical protein HOP14_05380 [Acidobacteria bacterium]|nr:hypothetical protein [Acidobacteriota bacterium]
MAGQLADVAPSPLGVLPASAAILQAAQEGTPPAAETPAISLSDLRSRLAERGVDVAMSYVVDWSRVPVGAGRADMIGRGLMDSSATVDLERLAGVPGATAFVQHQWKGGGDGSSALGIYQSFSNIDADDFQRVYEVWYEQRLSADRVRIKVGQVDANSEFAAVDGAGDFINASMGFSPTVFLLPTYPYPAPSVNVFVSPTAHLSVGAGVYGSQSAAARWRQPFVIAQATGSWSLSEGRDGYLRLGTWQQDQVVEDGPARPSAGHYVVAEQALWRLADGASHLRVFGQLGVTGAVTEGADRHLGGGLLWSGLGRFRPGDAVGFGATLARMGEAAEHPGVSELAMGPFVRMALAEWFVLTPDVQLVRHAGGDPDAGTRAVATLRLSATF